MNELRLWDSNEIKKAHARFTSKKLDRDICPKKEKLRDFRLSRSPGFHYNENKWVKAHTRRKRRSFLKRNICNEVYYRERERDFKTYGWETW